MGRAVIHSEFLYETAPFPSCHASTTVETPSGLVAAFFGGSHEKSPDVGVWVVRMVGGRWTAPVEAANGVQPDGSRFACWNPVLFAPRGGPLALYYKAGVSPATWWGAVAYSTDDGRTWSAPVRPPDGILGPVKNRPVQLADGTIVSPTSTESPATGWRAYFDRSTDNGGTWSATPLVGDPDVRAIQPSILVHPDGRPSTP